MIILFSQEQVVLFEGLSTSFLKPLILQSSEQITKSDNILQDISKPGSEDCTSLKSPDKALLQLDCDWLLDHGIPVHNPIILLPHTVMKYSIGDYYFAFDSINDYYDYDYDYYTLMTLPLSRIHIGFDEVILPFLLYEGTNTTNTVYPVESTIVMLYKSSQKLWYEKLRERLHIKLLQRVMYRHCNTSGRIISKLSTSYRSIDYTYSELKDLKCRAMHLNESIETDGIQTNQDINEYVSVQRQHIYIYIYVYLTTINQLMFDLSQDIFFKRLILIPKLSQQEFYRLIKLRWP